MKIKVELQVEPDEIPLATELLAVLRSITDHVSVNGSPVPAASPSPVASLPASAPSPTPPAAPSSTPSPGGSADTSSDMMAVFADILRSAEFADAPEELSKQLQAMAWTSVPGATQAERVAHPTFQAFLAAWREVALDPSILAAGRSAVPFAQVLTAADETDPDFKHAVRDAVIPGLLKHLAENRPPNANRAEFYQQAELFAGLASADVVPLEGACSTAAKMLRAEERRAAAVTVLGKLAELCGFSFSSKVQPATVEGLRAALAGAEGPEFAYDISYIRETLGWAGPSPTGGTPTDPPPSTSPDSAVSPLAPGSRFQPLVSLPGHTDLVFAVSHDPVRRHVMSAGKDGVVAVWGEDGAQVAALSVGDGMFVSCLDYHRGLGRSFGLGGTAARSAAGPTAPFCLLSVSAGANGYALDTPFKRDTQASTLRCLHETQGFITADVSAEGRPVVQFWDAAGATMRAVQTFTELEQHVTAMTRLPTPGTFATGSKDGHLQLWDLRQTAAPTGVLGHMPPSGTGSTLPRAADKIITTLDAAGPFGVACGGVDRTVRLFDIRAPGQGPLVELSLNAVVFKVAVAPGGRAAAVGGMPGVFIATGLDGSSAPALAPADPAWADGRGVQLYHDMRWNGDGTVLFAAGKNKTLDMLGVVN